MATGASTAQLAVLLVDPRKGILVQTRRHSHICPLLGVRHVVLAVTKMDLVGYRKDVFDQIVGDYIEFASPHGFASITPIPISARHGGNVTQMSGHTSWYRGSTLLEHLETVDVDSDLHSKPFRFQVQWVNRPNLDFRGYAGTVISGRIAKGDAVVVATSGKQSRVNDIVTYDGSLEIAEAGDAITLTLADDIDVSGGDILVTPTARPEVSDQFAAHVLWMDEEPLIPGRSYLARVGRRTVPVTVTAFPPATSPAASVRAGNLTRKPLDSRADWSVKMACAGKPAVPIRSVRYADRPGTMHTIRSKASFCTSR
jgi:bifunctional enzyme CysN/CysC